MKLVLRKTKLPQPQLCPDELYDVLLSCMRVDRSARIHASQLAQMMAMLMLNFDDVLHAQMTWPSLTELKLEDEKAREANVNEQDYHVEIDITSESFLANFESLQVPREAVALHSELQSGGFGHLHMATLHRPGGHRIDVAVKTLRSHDPITQERFVLEAKLLVACRHPHIIKALAFHTQDSPFMIVREYMCNRDLATYLHRFRPSDSEDEDDTDAADGRSVSLSERAFGWRHRAESSAGRGESRPESRSESPAPYRDELSVHDMIDIARQIASALHYLSKIHVIHRDVAARSVSQVTIPVSRIDDWIIH
jgi:hypothetical protein